MDIFNIALEPKKPDIMEVKPVEPKKISKVKKSHTICSLFRKLKSREKRLARKEQELLKKIIA